MIKETFKELDSSSLKVSLGRFGRNDNNKTLSIVHYLSEKNDEDVLLKQMIKSIGFI